MKHNKWINAALPALLLHCSIGSVYCWSLFKVNIAQTIGFPVGSVEWAFSLAIFFLGMSAAFCGNLVEKNVKLSALISTLFFTLGMIGTSISIQYNSLIGLYLSYGVIMGIGLGIGYLTPVKTLMLWFKENKGLATGIAITGFGLAKVIASPIIEYLIKDGNVSHLFIVLGGSYFVMMLLGTILIKKPSNSKSYKGEVFNIKKSISVIFNPIYISIWIVFFINITCGLALISQEKALISDWCNSAGSVGLIASITAFFNSFGRFGYSTLSDKLKKRSTVYETIFFTSSVACILVCLLTSFQLLTFIPGIVIIALIVVNIGYGGGFSTLPSLLSDKFGLNNVSVIHGFCLSAWAWAGLAGNNLGYYTLSYFGSNTLFLLLMTLYVIAFLITYKIIRN